jgi:hypothetical protein
MYLDIYTLNYIEFDEGRTESGVEGPVLGPYFNSSRFFDTQISSEHDLK